jgi:hypothetical protein
VRGEALEGAVVCALEPDRRARALEDARCTAGHPVGDVDDPGGLGEVAGELEECLRGLGFAPLHVVEPGVLERDRRVTGHHLEQSEVVRVELVEAELRDDDDAGHPVAVLERHREQRLRDLGGSRDSLAELVLRRVSDEERLARLGDTSGDPASHLDRHHPRRLAGGRGGEVPAERDGDEVVVLAEEEAAVVVVDEES